MDEDMEAEDQPDLAQETPSKNVFMPPSVLTKQLLDGQSYAHYSDIPATCAGENDCVLGIDEAGRGPVLGPMVYGVLAIPTTIERPLLAEAHHFDDSKVLTPAVRSNLMAELCKPGSELHKSCAWATKVMSARDIAAGMLKPTAAYNLNAQAMDATAELIQGIFDRGVNVTHIYVDTIGRPEVYQKRLERIFPATKFTVAKKADSLFPCVSAASVCAKVTRDAALETCYEAYSAPQANESRELADAVDGWGSGYPSDARCVNWLKRNMDPLFGWGVETRFSWGTAQQMLEAKGAQVKIDWMEEDEADDSMKVTQFFTATANQDDEGDELTNWFGGRVTEKAF